MKKICLKKRTQKRGFSLIELSIVILIISILITGSIGISKTTISNSKNKISKERLDVVYKAIGNFVAANRRLPCPASLTVIKGASGYGDESATPGTCTGAFKSTNATNLAYGMVPVKTLGLDPDMAEDGFGSKIAYVVDMRFTITSANTSSTDGFEITKSLPNENNSSTTDLGGIIPQGPSGTNILSNQNGVLLLLSHGANKFKGFNANGATQNTSAGVTDENDNGCDENSACNSILPITASFDREFVVNSTSANFDDIVIFKNKNQLATDAGLEFIMCNGYEANTAAGNASCPSKTWISPLKNAGYGSIAYSNDNACVRTCGKYGIWGSASVALAASNPMFYAYLNPTVSNVTGDGTLYTIVFNTKSRDQANNYNNGTGVFTAPVAGIYLFTYGLLLSNITNAGNLRGDVYLVVNDTTTYESLLVNPYNSRSNDSYLKTGNSSIVLYLNASDNVRIKVGIGGGTKTIGLFGSLGWTYFSGTLLSTY